jgi:hypothetical protein
MLHNVPHADLLGRVLNENSFGIGTAPGTDLFEEDVYIVSVLWNRTTMPSVFPLPFGKSSDIDDQARYAGNPSNKNYNFANLDILETHYANMPLSSTPCQSFIRNIELAQEAIQLVLSNQVSADNRVFFWFTRGATPTANDGSVGKLITTINNTSFYGIK